MGRTCSTCVIVNGNPYRGKVTWVHAPWTKEESEGAWNLLGRWMAQPVTCGSVPPSTPFSKGRRNPLSRAKLPVSLAPAALFI
jgi:hypothetical protein